MADIFASGRMTVSTMMSTRRPMSLKLSTPLVLEPPRHCGLSSIALVPGRHLIGASEGCGIRLHFEGIQDRHAIVLVGENRTVIKAMDSRTWVNDGPVAEMALRPGDRLSIGPLTFRIRQATRDEVSTFEETPDAANDLLTDELTGVVTPPSQVASIPVIEAGQMKPVATSFPPNPGTPAPSTIAPTTSSHAVPQQVAASTSPEAVLEKSITVKHSVRCDDADVERLDTDHPREINPTANSNFSESGFPGPFSRDSEDLNSRLDEIQQRLAELKRSALPAQIVSIPSANDIENQRLVQQLSFRDQEIQRRSEKIAGESVRLQEWSDRLSQRELQIAAREQQVLLDAEQIASNTSAARSNLAAEHAKHFAIWQEWEATYQRMAAEFATQLSAIESQRQSVSAESVRLESLQKEFERSRQQIEFERESLNAEREILKSEFEKFTSNRSQFEAQKHQFELEMETKRAKFESDRQALHFRQSQHEVAEQQLHLLRQAFDVEKSNHLKQAQSEAERRSADLIRFNAECQQLEQQREELNLLKSDLLRQRAEQLLERSQFDAARLAKDDLLKERQQLTDRCRAAEAQLAQVLQDIESQRQEIVSLRESESKLNEDLRAQREVANRTQELEITTFQASMESQVSDCIEDGDQGLENKDLQDYGSASIVEQIPTADVIESSDYWSNEPEPLSQPPLVRETEEAQSESNAIVTPESILTHDLFLARPALALNSTATHVDDTATVAPGPSPGPLIDLDDHGSDRVESHITATGLAPIPGDFGVAVDWGSLCSTEGVPQDIERSDSKRESGAIPGAIQDFDLLNLPVTTSSSAKELDYSQPAQIPQWNLVNDHWPTNSTAQGALHERAIEPWGQFVPSAQSQIADPGVFGQFATPFEEPSRFGGLAVKSFEESRSAQIDIAPTDNGVIAEKTLAEVSREFGTSISSESTEAQLPVWWIEKTDQAPAEIDQSQSYEHPGWVKEALRAESDPPQLKTSPVEPVNDLRSQLAMLFDLPKGLEGNRASHSDQLEIDHSRSTYSDDNSPSEESGSSYSSKSDLKPNFAASGSHIAENEAHSEDSVDDFMARLLARSRGGHEELADGEAAKTTDHDEPELNVSGQDVDRSHLFAEPKHKQDKQAVRENLQSFRQVAHLSARTALTRHTQSQLKNAMIAKGVLFGVSAFATAWFLGEPLRTQQMQIWKGVACALATILSATEFGRSRKQLLTLTCPLSSQATLTNPETTPENPESPPEVPRESQNAVSKESLNVDCKSAPLTSKPEEEAPAIDLAHQNFSEYETAYPIPDQYRVDAQLPVPISSANEYS